MNVLYSCGDYYPTLSGAASLIDDLAQALLAGGHSATVLTRRWEGLSSHETLHGYDILRLDYPVLYEKLDLSRGLITRSPAVLNRIRRILSKRKIDTVCIGLLDMSAWYFLLLRRIFRFRLVVYLHGGETRKLPAAEPSFRKLLTTVLEKADAVIAVSEQLSEEAIAFYGGAKSKLHVIHNAIDVDGIRKAPRFSHPREFIAFVGRLVPEKDAGTLINAYAAVQNEIGNIDLILAGRGSEEAALRELADRCSKPERIHFLGQVDRERCASIMKGALFTVLPSVTEGLPIVALESLAAETPLLGSAIPGIAALIRDNQNGRLFPPGDAIALSALIKQYCRDRSALRELREGAAGVDWDRYRMQKIIGRHVAVYNGSPGITGGAFERIAKLNK